jgi:hypothetical protein
MPTRAGVAPVKRIACHKHSSACVCQVIVGNVIVFCLFIARLVLPPNRRLQLTPLRGHKIVRILEAEFVPIAISIY